MPRIEQIQSLLEKEPNDAFLNFALAMELAKAGRVEESLAQFDRAAALDPNYLAAYFQKGRTLLAAGRVEEGRTTLKQGIERAQSSGDLHAAGEMGELLASVS